MKTPDHFYPNLHFECFCLAYEIVLPIIDFNLCWEVISLFQHIYTPIFLDGFWDEEATLITSRFLNGIWRAGVS